MTCSVAFLWPRFSKMSTLARFRNLTLLKENCKYYCIEKSYGNIRDSVNLSPCILTTQSRHYGVDVKDFVPFDTFLDNRRLQALRSVVVQVNSESSVKELQNYCSHFGNILGIHHYKLPKSQQNFMLLEFENENSAHELVSSCCFTNQLDTIPVQSPFLWFRTVKNNKHSMKKIPTNKSMPLLTTNGLQEFNKESLMDRLLNSISLNEQIVNLYSDTHLNDLGIRLRFLVARQIESTLASIFPQISVKPFGSSVNGFGKMGCDLDLLLKICLNGAETNSDSRLVFHTKRSTVLGRIQQQRYMEIIGDVIQLFIPGCSQIRRILQARIPIIKYNHDFAGLECDLSMSSMSGIYMSELLYTYGCLDDRVRPLVFAVRTWAHSIGVTNASPGKWITNFPLTLMVIFYLQNATNGPVLPSFNQLKKGAEKQDVRITEDYIDCTFLRNISKLRFTCRNDDSLEDLLFQFFNYFASFNFHENAISINQGVSITKPDFSPLYIVNPLETTLNVSKNVSSDECERLAMEFRNASWLLESQGKENKKFYWGLPLIFSQQNIQPKNSAFVPKKLPERLISVKDLFVHDDSLDKSNMDNVKESDIVQLKSEIEKQERSEKLDEIVFKNDEVKGQIEDIRRRNEENLKKKHRNIFETLLQEGGNGVWIERKTKR